MIKIESNFSGKHLISLDQLDRASIEFLFEKANWLKKEYQKSSISKLLEGKTVSLLFFEPSSRTFSSFSAAVKKLGGVTVEFQNMMETSSTVKGETLADTVNVFENYSDLIVMRHPEVGSLKTASQASYSTPLVNAGDGAGEHPTQALLDLFTIQEQFGKLDGLKGLLAGDLLFGRTVHSLIKAFSNFDNMTLYLLSPKELRMPQEIIQEAQEKGLKLIEIEDEKDIPTDLHFWYWTRVQKERFESNEEYEKVKNKFILTPKLIEEKANSETIFMHPLPRVGEILPEVDKNPKALYLKDQIKNGLYIRMTIISLILNRL